MSFGNRYSLEEFARAANRPQGGPLAPPAVPAPLPADLGRELVQILVSDIKRRFATGTTPDGQKWKPLRFNRPSGGGKPLQDTGRLMASIVGRADATGVTVGTRHPGASLQNFGGTVRPKKGKFLAIPLTKEAKRAGSPRRIRGTPAMPLFAKRTGLGGRLIGHFLLVKQAKIPERRFMGISKEAERAVAAALAEYAARRWQAQGQQGV